MPFLKQSLDLQCPSGDGHNFVLLEPLTFITRDGTYYRGITGATTDGASTPAILWSKYPPFGLWWLPAVLHDCAYRCMLEKLVGTKWIRVQLTKAEADSLLLEAMEDQQVGEFDREAIYNAVKDFGGLSFLADMAEPIIR